jgi:hypothetical protein
VITKSGCLVKRGHPPFSDLIERFIVVSGNQPLGIVQVLELLQYLIEIFNVLKYSNPKQISFEGAKEPLYATIAFRRAHISR